RLVRGQGPEPAERLPRSRLAEFGGIAVPELVELGRVVVIPGPQLGRRGDILRPLVKPGGVLAQSAWPHPVHQHASVIVGRGLFVDAADPDVRTHRGPPFLRSFSTGPDQTVSPAQRAVDSGHSHFYY